jgi:hypothetical protein
MTETLDQAHTASTGDMLTTIQKEMKTTNQDTIIGPSKLHAHNQTLVTTSITSTPTIPPTGFLSLSAELRNRIYFLCLRSDGPIELRLWNVKSRMRWVGNNVTDIETHLLAACSLVYAEATPVLYGSNTFIILDTGRPSTSFFTQVNRQSLQHIQHLEFWRPPPLDIHMESPGLRHCTGLKTLVLHHHLKIIDSMEPDWAGWVASAMKAWLVSRNETNPEAVLQILRLWPQEERSLLREVQMKLIKSRLATMLEHGSQDSSRQ